MHLVSVHHTVWNDFMRKLFRKAGTSPNLRCPKTKTLSWKILQIGKRESERNGRDLPEATCPGKGCIAFGSGQREKQTEVKPLASNFKHPRSTSFLLVFVFNVPFSQSLVFTGLQHTISKEYLWNGGRRLFWKLQESWCLQNDEITYLSGSGSLYVTIKTKSKATGW